MNSAIDLVIDISPSVQPQEGHCEKRCEIQGGGQEMAVIAKFLIPTYQVNLYCLLYISLGFGTKFT